MGTPKGNGLVEITGENKAMDKGWFCMDLMGFLRGTDWETFHSAFQQAKSGNCPYKDKCKRYERTVKKRGHHSNMASHTNPICAKCAKAYEQLNGRYCTLLKRNVEYDKTPACQSQNNKK